MTRWMVEKVKEFGDYRIQNGGVMIADAIPTKELATQIVADHNQAEAMREALEACIAIMERDDCENEFDWHSIQINQAKAALAAGKG